MTKVVILTGMRVFPIASGGQLRTGGFARALARMGYDVELYSLTGRRPDYMRALRDRRLHLTDVLENRLVEETYLGPGPALHHAYLRWRGYPRFWQYSMLKAGKGPARMREVLSLADVIVSDHSFIPRIIGPWSRTPWYLLSHQLEYQLLEQGTPKLQLYAKRMYEHECRAAGEYTDIFACAEDDQAFFKASDVSNRLSVPVIRCGVDPTQYAFDSHLRERARRELGLGDRERLIVFSGSSYAPNNEALAELKVFAQRERDFLEARGVYLLILGSMEKSPFRQDRLIATGRVADVRPFFAAADAGLNPVTRGAGSNVKLFEYMAAKLPIISTEFGVRGSELRAGDDYFLLRDTGLKAAISELCDLLDSGRGAEFAEQVWSRHRTSCDIGELVRAAVAVARDFPPPADRSGDEVAA